MIQQKIVEFDNLISKTNKINQKKFEILRYFKLPVRMTLQDKTEEHTNQLFSNFQVRRQFNCLLLRAKISHRFEQSPVHSN